MRPVPVSTFNQTNKECLPKFVQTDNASSSIKTPVLVNVQTWGDLGNGLDMIIVHIKIDQTLEHVISDVYPDTFCFFF